MRIFLPLLVLLVTAACTVAEDKKDEKKLDLFPLALGTKWEYVITVNGEDKELLQEITKVAPGKKGERDIATVESKVAGQTLTEEVSADEKAVYRHAMQGMKLETPLPIVKYPHKTGATWKESIKIATEEADVAFDAKKSEEVKVAAGTYTAYPIVMELEVMGKKVTSKNWYADGVGMVKQEVDFAGTKVTMELKKFTKAK
jgi:hypothetical protein